MAAVIHSLHHNRGSETHDANSSMGEDETPDRQPRRSSMLTSLGGALTSPGRSRPSNLQQYKQEEEMRRQFKPQSPLQYIFIKFEDPMYDLTAKVISSTISFLIVLSVFTFVLETLPNFQDVPGKCDFANPKRSECRRVPKPVFWQIETGCMIVFTMEYLIRVFTVHSVPEHLWLGYDREDSTTDKIPSRLQLTYRYVVRWMNLIDLAAILPYWVEVIGGIESSFSVLRIIRLTRMFRMLKSRSVRALVQVISIALKESAPALLILLFFSVMAIVLVGTLEFIFESGRWSIAEDDLLLCCSEEDVLSGDRRRCLGCYVRPTFDGVGRESSPFQSIPIGMYYVIITMMTVGYGDMVPTTTAGRVIAVATTYFGIVGLALPISVIGNNFTRAYEDFRDEQRKMRQIKEGTDGQTRFKSAFSKVLGNIKVSKAFKASVNDKKRFKSDRRNSVEAMKVSPNVVNVGDNNKEAEEEEEVAQLPPASSSSRLLLGARSNTTPLSSSSTMSSAAAGSRRGITDLGASDSSLLRENTVILHELYDDQKLLTSDLANLQNSVGSLVNLIVNQQRSLDSLAEQLTSSRRVIDTLLEQRNEEDDPKYVRRRKNTATSGASETTPRSKNPDGAADGQVTLMTNLDDD